MVQGQDTIYSPTHQEQCRFEGATSRNIFAPCTDRTSSPILSKCCCSEEKPVYLADAFHAGECLNMVIYLPHCSAMQRQLETAISLVLPPTVVWLSAQLEKCSDHLTPYHHTNDLDAYSSLSLFLATPSKLSIATFLFQMLQVRLPHQAKMLMSSDMTLHLAGHIEATLSTWAQGTHSRSPGALRVHSPLQELFRISHRCRHIGDCCHTQGVKVLSGMR